MSSLDRTKERATNKGEGYSECGPHVKKSQVVSDELLKSEDKYRLAVESTDDSIFIVDRKYKYFFVNRKHESRLGLPGEKILGQPYGRFHSPEETRFFIEKVAEVVRTRSSVQHVHRSQRDGRYFLRTLSPIAETDGKIAAVTVISKDISELKMNEEKLLSLSNTDELTGLFNRRGFFALAGQQLKMSQRLKKGMSLLSADLDGLKKINDTFGHQVGDRALIETASILRGCFRDVDIIARIGGDEFVILLIEPSHAKLDAYTARLQRKIEQRNRRYERNYTISISIGIAHFEPGSLCTIDDLIARADGLMYEQKRNKKKSEPQILDLFSSNNAPAST